MASRYYDNSDQAQRFQPGTTARADEVDAKMDQIAAGFEEAERDIDRSLKLPTSDASQELNASPLQRRRRVVGFDADGNLALLQGFAWRGDWVPGTEYFINDVFRDPDSKNLYVTLARHVSAASLLADITVGRVGLAISVEEVEQARNAALAARDKARQWAEADENAVVEPGQFSARHHARKSEASAQASSTSAGHSADARDKSQRWAEAPENESVEPEQYSSKHHARKSEASAQASSTSAGQSAGARDASQQWAGASATSAQASSQSANQSAAARNESQSARDQSRRWAEADDEVAPGQRSAKYWAGQAASAASEGVINDDREALDLTWSSQKIGFMFDGVEKTLGDIESLADEINGGSA